MAGITNVIEFAQLIFTLAVYAAVAGVAIWGSLKLTRTISATRRATEMKEAATVAAARARAAKRATQRLA